MQNKKAGFVYVAKFKNADTPVKIGMTTNPKNREKGLNATSLPSKLEMVRTWAVANARLVESLIHKDKDLKSYRTEGKEWFTVPSDKAVEVCEKYAIQMSNDQFKKMYNDFSKADKNDKKIFYQKLLERSHKVEFTLTQTEQDVPGYIDNNRKKEAVGIKPDIFRDIVAFNQEWQGLSMNFRDFLKPRPCDSLRIDTNWKCSDGELYNDSNIPLMNLDITIDDLKGDQAITIKNRLDKYAKNFEHHLEGMDYNIKMFASYLAGRASNKRTAKQDLYAVRMEPMVKLREFIEETASERQTHLKAELKKVDKDYANRLINCFEQKNKEHKKELEQYAEQYWHTGQKPNVADEEHWKNLTKDVTTPQQRANSDEWMSWFFVLGIIFLFGGIMAGT